MLYLMRGSAGRDIPERGKGDVGQENGVGEDDSEGRNGTKGECGG